MLTPCASCVRLQQLSPTASIQDAQKWLLKNRFSSYTRLFSHFSGTRTLSNTLNHGCNVVTVILQVTYPTCCLGSDLLKLTRDDLVQICGPADGIRLFNALKSRCVCVGVFVCVWGGEKGMSIMDEASLFMCINDSVCV